MKPNELKLLSIKIQKDTEPCMFFDTIAYKLGTSHTQVTYIRYTTSSRSKNKKIKEYQQYIIYTTKKKKNKAKQSKKDAHQAKLTAAIYQNHEAFLCLVWD